MPYNNTPIAPPNEFTGTVSLPLARVKKIIAADDDISSCSNNAAFVIAVATEMFVQYLVERCHDVVKSERKPRRNIQYKDVANAVARIDNLEFLADVVPRTQSYKSFKEGQAKRAAVIAAQPKPPQADAPEPDGQGLQQQQLPFGSQPNGQTSFPGAASPVAVNGHARRSSQSHSRNHSLEHQNIIHPNPPADSDPMQIDAVPSHSHPRPPAVHQQPTPGSQSPETNREPTTQQLRMEPLTGNAGPNGTMPPPPTSNGDFGGYVQNGL